MFKKEGDLTGLFFHTRRLVFYRRVGRGGRKRKFEKSCGREWEIGKPLLSLEYPLWSIFSLLAAQAFLQKLVRNLFAEGNDLFREKDFKLSLVQYVEGLNVADYAASDEVTIPKELLCKLHVNRAACYFAMVSTSQGIPRGQGGLHGCSAVHLEKMARGVSVDLVHSHLCHWRRR